jgi:hypothetical protein
MRRSLYILTALVIAPSLGAQQLAPGGRSCASATWSGARQLVVMYGGSSVACGVAPIADGALWGWDGTRWRRLAVTGGPGPREDAHLIALTPTRELMLVGGRRDGMVHTDTWRYDTAWRAQGTSAPNPGRLEHSGAVYDPTRRELVLFGGGSSSTPGQLSRQTAILRDSTWSITTDAFGPAARVGHSMTWSRHHGGVVMYGGFAASGSFRDTWRWDGLRWHLVDSLGPTHTEGPALVATDQGTLLIGAGLDAQPGQPLRVWQWREGSGWQPIANNNGPPLRIGQLLVFDGRRGVVVLFGGNLPEQPPTSDVWEYHVNLNRWTRVP